MPSCSRLSRTLRAAPKARWPSAILDSRCARRRLGRRPGRKDGLGVAEPKDEDGVECAGWGGLGLAGAAAAGAEFAALLGFFEPVGIGLNGDDLGIMDEAVDQRDDAGGGGKDLVPLGEGAIG